MGHPKEVSFFLQFNKITFLGSYRRINETRSSNEPGDSIYNEIKNVEKD